MATIYLQTRLDPEAAPAYDVPPRARRAKAHWLLLRDVVPMVGLMVVIVIMMINGFVTPSEAAAFGALGVLILAALYRCLTWEAIRKRSVRGRAARHADGLSDRLRLGDVQPASGLLRCLAGLITLGHRVRPRPDCHAAGDVRRAADPGHVHGADLHHAADRADLLSAGHATRVRPDLVRLIMLLALEISFTTPPFGLLLFVMKGVAPPDTTMREIYRAAFPFILCSLLLVALLIAFPILATWLPSLG
jgi:TRAP-type mannitol/chloroaromatic compound transport system permease large subunit